VTRDRDGHGETDDCEAGVWIGKVPQLLFPKVLTVVGDGFYGG